MTVTIYTMFFLLFNNLPISVHAADSNSGKGKDYFLKFKESTAKPELCSEAIKAFCDNASIQALHTYSYYKSKSIDANNFQEPQEIKNTKLIFSGLSNVAMNCYSDKFDNDELLSILKNLSYLQTKLLNTKEAGSVNVLMYDSISILKSGIIFNVASKTEPNRMEELSSKLKDLNHDNEINTSVIKEVLRTEDNYTPINGNVSEIRLLMDMAKEKYAEDFNEFKNKTKKKDINPDDLITFDMFYKKIKINQSPNPIIDFDDIGFTSDFIVVKRVELLSRLILPYLTTKSSLPSLEDWKQANLNVNVKEYLKEINMKYKANLFDKMTPLEKEVYNNPSTESEIEQVIYDIGNQIHMNLGTKGKNIISQVQLRCELIATNKLNI